MLTINIIRHGRDKKVVLIVKTERGEYVVNDEEATIFIDGEQCHWQEEVDGRGKRTMTVRAR